MIAKKIWVIKMTKQMKGIMRVRIFLNRKQKKKKKNQKGKKKKQKEDDGNRKENHNPPVSRTHQVAPPTDYILH